MSFSCSHTSTDCRHARRIATRNNILEAAERIILAEGYTALTTKKLVEEAGVSERTIFNHFDSLEHVALSRAGDLLTETFEGHKLPEVSDTPQLPSTIENFFREHIASDAGAEALGRFTLLAISLSSTIENNFDTMGSAIFKALRELAEKLISQLDSLQPPLPREQLFKLALYTHQLSSSIAVGMGKAIFEQLDTGPRPILQEELVQLENLEMLETLREGIFWAFDQVNAGKPVL